MLSAICRWVEWDKRSKGERERSPLSGRKMKKDIKSEEANKRDKWRSRPNSTSTFWFQLPCKFSKQIDYGFQVEYTSNWHYSFEYAWLLSFRVVHSYFNLTVFFSPNDCVNELFMAKVSYFSWLVGYCCCRFYEKIIDTACDGDLLKCFVAAFRFISKFTF